MLYQEVCIQFNFCLLILPLPWAYKGTDNLSKKMGPLILQGPPGNDGRVGHRGYPGPKASKCFHSDLDTVEL